MPVLPPPPIDKDGRQDVLLLKQQLAEALGDNGPSYWQALTDFVSGKLNRQEFDFYANLYLSRKNGTYFVVSVPCRLSSWSVSKVQRVLTSFFYLIT